MAYGLKACSCHPLSLFDNGNISKYSYIIFEKKKKDGPLETELFWFDTLDMVGDPGDIREDAYSRTGGIFIRDTGRYTAYSLWFNEA